MPEPEPTVPDGDHPRPRPSPAGPSSPAAAGDEPAVDPATTDRVDDRPDDPAQPRPRRAASADARRRGLLLAAVAAVLVAAAAAAIVVIVVRGSGHSTSTRPSAPAVNETAATITRSDAANAFVAGATTDIVAVTAYDYRSLDIALSNGQSVTTGAYRTSFQAALTGSLGAQARRLHRVQTFALKDAGIGTIASDGASAQVLVFGVQSVSDDSTGGKPRATLVTLTATMQRQGNRYLIARLSAGQNAGLPAGTAGLRAAAEAGRAEVAAVLTLRHDHFDADYDKALAGAVDPLRASLTGQSAATRSQVTRGRYDLAGTVTAVGIQRAAGDTVVMLVAATGTRTTSDGRTAVVVDGRYQVTVVLVSGVWVTSAIDAVTAR